MPLTTGPINIDKTYPVGSAQKVNIVDNDIRDTKDKLGQVNDVAHFAWSHDRAGQIKSGKSPIYVGTQATILALTASDYPDVLAYAYDTDQLIISRDDDADDVYEWVKIQHLDTSTRRDEVSADDAAEHVTNISAADSFSIIKKNAGNELVAGPITAPSDGLWRLRVRGHFFLNSSSSATTAWFAGGFQVDEDSGATVTEYWRQVDKFNPAGSSNGAAGVTVKIHDDVAVTNGLAYEVRLVATKESGVTIAAGGKTLGTTDVLIPRIIIDFIHYGD
jgi:hypothetical protein